MNEKERVALKYVKLVLLVTLVIAGLGYQIVSKLTVQNDAARIKACIVGESGLVFPGPGDATPGVFWGGHIVFHRNENVILWKMYHSALLGTIHAMEIIGPGDPANLLDAPVYLTLCGGNSNLMCVSPAPNTLEQKIVQTSPDEKPLKDFITTIVKNRDTYMIRIKTQNFPNGALVSRLVSSC